MREEIARTQGQLGAILRKRRRSLGLTQTAAAAKTGARQATISELEAGTRDTRLQTLFEALAALDLEVVIRPRSRSDNKNLEAIF